MDNSTSFTNDFLLNTNATKQQCFVEQNRVKNMILFEKQSIDDDINAVMYSASQLQKPLTFNVNELRLSHVNRLSQIEQQFHFELDQLVKDTGSHDDILDNSNATPNGGISELEYEQRYTHTLLKFEDNFKCLLQLTRHRIAEIKNLVTLNQHLEQEQAKREQELPQQQQSQNLDSNNNSLIVTETISVKKETLKCKRKQSKPKQTQQQKHHIDTPIKSVKKHLKNFIENSNENTELSENLITVASPTSTNVFTSQANVPDMLMYDFSLTSSDNTGSGCGANTSCYDVIKKATKSKKSKRTDVSLQDHSKTPRKAKALPEEATRLMKKWYVEHSENPYPSDEERRQMALTGSISENQVKAWFANKRNRSNNTRPKKQRASLSESNLYEMCVRTDVGVGGLIEAEMTDKKMSKCNFKKKNGSTSCKQTQVEHITSTTTQLDNLYNSNSTELLSPFTATSPSASSLSCTSANQQTTTPSLFRYVNSKLISDIHDFTKVNPNQFINDGSSSTNSAATSTGLDKPCIKNIFLNDDETQYFTRPTTPTSPSPPPYHPQHAHVTLVDNSFCDDTETVLKINYVQPPVPPSQQPQQQQLQLQQRNLNEYHHGMYNSHNYSQSFRSDNQCMSAFTSFCPTSSTATSSNMSSAALQCSAGSDHHVHNQQYVCDTPPPIRYTNGPNVTQYTICGSGNGASQRRSVAPSPSPTTTTQYSIADMISLPPSYSSATSGCGTATASNMDSYQHSSPNHNHNSNANIETVDENYLNATNGPVETSTTTTTNDAFAYYVQQYHNFQQQQLQQQQQHTNPYYTTIYPNDMLTANQFLVAAAAAQAVVYRQVGSPATATTTTPQQSHQQYSQCLDQTYFYNVYNNNQAMPVQQKPSFTDSTSGSGGCGGSSSCEAYNRAYNIQPITPPLPHPPPPLPQPPQLPRSQSSLPLAVAQQLKTLPSSNKIKSTLNLTKTIKQNTSNLTNTTIASDMDENALNSNANTMLHKNFTNIELRNWCITSHPKLASTLLTTSPNNLNITNNKKNY